MNKNTFGKLTARETCLAILANDDVSLRIIDKAEKDASRNIDWEGLKRSLGKNEELFKELSKVSEEIWAEFTICDDCHKRYRVSKEIDTNPAFEYFCPWCGVGE